MNLRNTILLASLAMAPAFMSEAATKVTFETEDYQAVGVYDTWEASPFRTGTLQGNAAVTANPNNSEANSSEKVLAVQRSRYGSNTFGVRVDLNEPFDLTTETRFVHVLVNTPKEGRMMLVGLGKRRDREEQSRDVEQFWVFSTTEAVADEWVDAVFPVKGAGGIDIYSLVLVPYAESSHTLDGDFVAYIDDIEVMTTAAPRVGGEDYPVNFDKDLVNARYNERHIEGVSLDGKSIAVTEQTHYVSKLETPFAVKAGQSVLPAIDYKGEWMHGYVYIDVNNDGQFSFDMNGRVPADGSELMAFSYYKGYNHKGASSSNSSFAMTNFTVPADMANGFYRMRYKIDWDNNDPGGSLESGNLLTANAGGVIDVLLNVHGDRVSVSQANRNGEVLAADGSKLENYSANFGEPFTIKMKPENGFEYEGIRVRHGYNLDGPATVHGNPQYFETTFNYDQFGDDDTFTIPAEIMNGDVHIEGLFVETGKVPTRVKVTYRLTYEDKVLATKEYSVEEGEPYPAPDFELETSAAYYSIETPEGTVGSQDETVDLALTHNLPFEVSASPAAAKWYTLTITADAVYLHDNGSLGYMSLDPDANAYADRDEIRWCFTGNAYEGFKLYNRKAGDGKILSSSVNTAANTGGNTYVTLVSEPVTEGNNTYWIPCVSSFRTGGFTLHQLGYVNNKVNSRDERLAYWTGGFDAGSTIVATEDLDETTGIDLIGGDQTDMSDAVYYNLQGIRVKAENLVPGIYIRKAGGKTEKILVR